MREKNLLGKKFISELSSSNTQLVRSGVCVVNFNRYVNNIAQSKLSYFNKRRVLIMPVL